jgi:amidohydrolase
LRSFAGEDAVVETLPVTGAEDFSYYQQRVPGLFLWLGVRDPDVPAAEAAPNHSPQFVVDEDGLLLGVRTLSHLTLDYMEANPR